MHEKQLNAWVSRPLEKAEPGFCIYVCAHMHVYEMN